MATKANPIKNFDKLERKIFDYVHNRITFYFESNCFKKLENRYEMLRDMWNMKTDTSKRFRSKLVFPMVKERMIFTQATTKQNYRAEPIATIDPGGDNTPMENAISAQGTVIQNLKRTEFRRKCLNLNINSCAQFGASVAFSGFHADTRELPKTTIDGNGIRERTFIKERRRNIENTAIHILNYFQDPNASNDWSSNYQGHIRRWDISELVALIENTPDGYIKKNLKIVLGEAREDAATNHQYFQENENDEENIGVDIFHLYGKLLFDGNEEDDTIYGVDVVGDNIIRMVAWPIDEGRSPYSIFTYTDRLDYWWGNTEGENVIPHQRYTDVIMNMTSDNALENIQRLRFFEDGSIDPADINNRFTTGGFIKVKVTDKPLNQLIHEDQPKDISNSSTQFVLQKINESAQGVTSTSDLSRRPSEGGIQNKTATAAIQLQGRSDTVEADYMENFGYGIEHLIRTNVIMLQQFIDLPFSIRPDPRKPPINLEPSNIMGEFHYTIKTSLQKNTILELSRIQNAVTTLINFVGTGRPEFQNVNLINIVRELVRKMDIGDVDEIIPEQGSQPQPGQDPNAGPIPFNQNQLGGPVNVKLAA